MLQSEGAIFIFFAPVWGFEPATACPGPRSRVRIRRLCPLVHRGRGALGRGWEGYLFSMFFEREREREKESMYVCDREGKRLRPFRVYVCVCVCSYKHYIMCALRKDKNRKNNSISALMETKKLSTRKRSLFTLKSE